MDRRAFAALIPASIIGLIAKRFIDSDAPVEAEESAPEVLPEVESEPAKLSPPPAEVVHHYYYTYPPQNTYWQPFYVANTTTPYVLNTNFSISTIPTTNTAWTAVTG